MIKLLVNAPVLGQQVIEVQESGGYFDQDRILWDERKDGPLPDITVGGMKRDGGSLVFDQSELQVNTAIYEESQKKPEVRSKLDWLIDTLVGKGILTKEELNNA
jgi:hypothetical protein